MSIFPSGSKDIVSQVMVLAETLFAVFDSRSPTREHPKKQTRVRAHAMVRSMGGQADRDWIIWPVSISASLLIVRRTFLVEFVTLGELASPLRKVEREGWEKRSCEAKFTFKKNLIAARLIEMLEADISSALSDK